MGARTWGAVLEGEKKKIKKNEGIHQKKSIYYQGQTLCGERGI